MTNNNQTLQKIGRVLMILEITISGFLFLFIIVLNLLMVKLGHGLEAFDYDSESKLQKIIENPRNYKLSLILGFIEHLCIILLTIMLFIAYSQHNILLGVVWLTFRTGEGLFMVFNDINDLKLIKISNQYAITSGVKRKSFIDIGQIILQKKYFRFSIISILFSVGTLSYTIVFLKFNLVPTIIGWLGIIASITYGLGNGIKLVKPKFIGLMALGGLLVLLFESILGGWLLFSQIIQ
ncbi:MAG: hypothetical protein HeimC2_11500 [Candidatus Heimdallarchaeota archaeon LC_2]|nr:MAG: hypothetical protein HeimC2_11500 [Candidatus Heimdallarchaeota archaeon LC_2]